MFNNILIVCVGNICRSPMAEAILRNALHQNKQSNCHVFSAGLGALTGYPPDNNAQELLLEKGLDISQHRASQINKEMIRKADLILVMEQGHKLSIEENEPSAKGKVFRLGEWGKFDIPDPYQKGMSAFKISLDLIEQGVEQWVNKLAPAR